MSLLDALKEVLLKNKSLLQNKIKLKNYLKSKLNKETFSSRLVYDFLYFIDKYNLNKLIVDKIDGKNVLFPDVIFQERNNNIFKLLVNLFENYCFNAIKDNKRAILEDNDNSSCLKYAEQLLGGVNTDDDVAYFASLAANNNYVPAIEFLIEISLNCKEDKYVYEYLQKGSNLNSPFAKFILASWYHEGRYVKKDLKKSFKLLKDASLLNSLALNELGEYYLKGEGTEKNEVKAFQCFKDAYRFGNFDSLKNLQLCYENGYGIKKNQELAKICYETYNNIDKLNNYFENI